MVRTDHNRPQAPSRTARREALGWSAKELGIRCGIDERLLNDWEQSVGSPRLDAAAKWAGALGLDLMVSVAGVKPRSSLNVDWPTRQVTVNGIPVRLTPMERKVLERLAAMPDELVTHRALFRQLYGEDAPYRAESSAIRVLITKLRRLLPLQIRARWGRGYVISGIAPSSAHGRSNTDQWVQSPPEPEAKSDKGGCGALPVVTNSITIARPPLRREGTGFNHQSMRRPARAPIITSSGRGEELNVIERFLAERGATRCPDMATIQRTPLPTLVWNKTKHQWVRPAVATFEAS
jgi:transcriptional regulator with XRE-family HTH domain